MAQPLDLLTTHEARSLGRSIVARIVVIALMVCLSLLHLAGVLDSGVVAETNAEALTIACVGALALGVAARGLWLARQVQDLPLVGAGIVATDLLILAALPLLWLTTGAERDPSPAFLLKNELFAVALVLMVINALSLQPRYPATMTAGALMVHAGVLAYVWRDPRVVYTDSFLQHFSTPAVNPGVVSVRMSALLLVGVVLTLITRSARRLVHDAVALEATNTAMREQQAQLLMEGRMTALASLVAGVAHELNSPLGALSGSLQTAQRAVERLGDEGQAPPNPRVLTALAESTGTGRLAIERMTQLLGSLKDFASLDQAQVQRVDVGDGLRATVAVLDATLTAGVRVELLCDPLPALLCRPAELNQVFRTLTVNALEVLDGRGCLQISGRATPDAVEITFSDDGPGMDAALLATLFELRLGGKRERIGMGLGLPLARRIVERHGGQLRVASTPGRGTTFTVALPLRTSLEAAISPA